MGSLYAIASRFAAHGIGNTAARAVDGLWRAGMLDALIALGHEPTNVDERRIVDVRFPPRRAFFFWPEKRYYLAKNRHFDRRCLARIDGPHEVVHLWNSQATRSARAAKRLGKKLIIERASTHIVTQTRRLVDAYARLGIDYQPTYAETIERCREEYELADLVLTPSENSYRSFADEGFDMTRVVRCPFGIDLEKTTPRERAPEKFVALFVGQVGVRKGVFTLLAAWDKAQLDGELWLVGGEEEAVRAHFTPWRNRENIRFMGFRGDVPELMRRASAFVFPSLEEGSALVTYEAMACGLPSILTGEAGAVARDGQEALTIGAHDVDALAAALTRLKEDHDLAARLGLAARRRVEQFPWSAYGDRIATVHRLLADGADGPTIQQELHI
ncbi:MAG TPA: glycosyltransferase family 4 protein [bacterium]|nr:glycosyltransferase family 4 protein [bacterium]